MNGAGRETGPYGRKVDPHLIAAEADGQYGVLSLAQLKRLGVSATAVHKRAAKGELHRIHRGVYAVGRRRLDFRGRCMAAALACGAGAAVSHRSAAGLRDLLDAGAGPIHVTVPSRAGRIRGPGIVLHRSSTLVQSEVARVDGIPCTSTERTLLDLADTLTQPRLRSIMTTADRQRIVDGRRLNATLARAGGRPAAKRLLAALAAHNPPERTRTELERLALALFEQAGLERPLVNVFVDTAEGPKEVDFFWPNRALVVEADSWEWHSSRTSFEEDRHRDQLLRARGLTVVRVTWRQIEHDVPTILRALTAVQ